MIAAPGKLDEIQDGKSTKFTNSDMVGVLALAQKMAKNGWFGDGYTGTDFGGAYNLLVSGKAASQMLASWMFNAGASTDAATKDAAMTWSAGPMPGSKALVAAGHGIVIVKGTKQPDLAWKLMEWTADGTWQQLLADNYKVPANVKYQMKPLGNDFDKNVVAPSLAQLADADACRLRHIRCPGLYDAMGPVMQGIATGQVTPEAGAAELQKAFEKSCV